MSDMIFNYKKYYLEKTIFAPIFPLMDGKDISLKPYFQDYNTLTTHEYIVNRACNFNVYIVGTYPFLIGTTVGLVASMVIDSVLFITGSQNSTINQITHMGGDAAYYAATLPLHLAIMGTSDIVDLVSYLAGANSDSHSSASEL